jgi:drug/metabolite transporter (DMT)-like permease
MAIVAAYVFGFAALTSTSTLLTWLALRPRNDQGDLASPARYLAHAMLFAVIALFALWLQALRALTAAVVALLIGLYAFLELAVLFGTRGSVELPVRR